MSFDKDDQLERDGAYQPSHITVQTADGRLIQIDRTPEKIELGTKHDQDKIRWSLLPWDSVREIVKVLTRGAIKYAPDNWQHVPDAHNRYFDALQRHLVAWKTGEKDDPEWGLNHLAHAGCCLLFLLWLDLNGDARSNAVQSPNDSE